MSDTPTAPETPALTPEDRAEIAREMVKVIEFVSMNPPPRELLERAITAELDAGGYALSAKLPHGDAIRFVVERAMPGVVRRAIELGAPAESEAAEGHEGVTSSIPTGGTFQRSDSDAPRPGPGFTSYRRPV